MYLYPNEPHSYEATSEPWNVYWVVLGGYQMDALSRLLGLPKSGVYTLKDSTVPLAHIRRAIELLNNESDFVGMECAKISYTFLMDIYRFKEQGEEKEKENREYSNERLQPVFEYIHENYNRVLTLDELSDILDVSNQYLCLLFKRAVHMRPMEYLNRLRVNKSKEWLADKPQLTISEIAEKVGFETPGYFSKMFKRYEGVTPENWRRLNANGYCRHVE
jgi:AraC-like DNA-binding protein